jgi:hypothetical protein
MRSKDTASLSTAWRHLESEKVAPLILNLGTRWMRVFSSKPPPVLSPEYNLSINWIGSWVDPRADLGGFREERGLASTEPRTAQVLSSRTDYAIPAPEMLRKIMNASVTILLFYPRFAAGTAGCGMFQCLLYLHTEEYDDKARSHYPVTRPNTLP